MRSFDKRVLYFNEASHSYKDDNGLVYTSMTTVIGKYEEEFNANEVAAKTSRKYFNIKGHRYYHMTTKDILKYWKDINSNSCIRGNDRHNYLEDAIKSANGYNREGSKMYINDRIYTIDDVLENSSFGEASLELFVKAKVQDKYPTIFEVIKYHVLNGWRIYAEVGVYNPKLIVSGLIDVLLIKDDKFRILDWKTNKDKIHFNAGYFKRNNLGEFTTEWVDTPKKVFKAPINNIQSCHGSTYTLQLSGYAYLVEKFGLTCDLLILAHIRPKELDSHGIISNDKEDIIEFHKIKYLKDDVDRMFNHHFRIHANTQSSLF